MKHSVSIGLVGLLAACGGDDSLTNVHHVAAKHITDNTTWSTSQQILADTEIDAGVTVTVAAGTAVTVKSGITLTVSGTLALQGTSASKITISPDAGAPTFQAIAVETGGTVDMQYTVMTGGSLVTTGSGTVTISDSQLSHAFGDLLVMVGGNLDVSYTIIGVEPPGTDTTHCDLHFGGSGDVVTLTHSIVSTSSYGAMFYSGAGADFTYTNWLGNVVNVDRDPGVAGDFSNSFFEGAPPTGTGVTRDNPAVARLPMCNGTNDATCAGPRP